MARSRKYEKNLAKVQSYLDDSYDRKLQVGTHIEKNVHEGRKVGDVWTDSDGTKWEQKQGYRSKINKTPDVGIFSKVCKECEKPCIKKRDKETFNRMNRCFYCQLDYEVLLKSKTIGHRGNKWYFWVKLQELKRWETVDKEVEQLVRENSEVKWNDKKFMNALANNNVEMSIKKNLQ